MLDKDLYEILDVKKDATEPEIRKAFLKLAKKYHPDVNPDNKDAEQRFKEVNLAYEVLKDPKKRAHYEQMRAAGANPFAGAQGQPQGQWRTSTTGGPYGPEIFTDFGLGDLFQEIFGGSFNAGNLNTEGHFEGGGGFSSGGFRGAPRSGRRSRAGTGMRQRGADRQATLSIPFLEAAKGAERMLELPDGRRLTVKIPEGVDTGSKIKLSRQGEPGMAGGESGDLIINLEVQPHPYFTRDGEDIVVELPISFSEAVLGAEVEVSTIDGPVVLKIPKGISSQQRLKLAGKGVRSAKTGTRGDQFVEVFIKVPKADPAYIEAAEKLKSSSYRPRS